jgi:phosphatidylserine synthase
MTQYHTQWLSVLALLIPIAGALRLARHNINRHLTKGYLIGMPIGASAVIIPLIIFTSAPAPLAAACVVILAWLYVSTFKFKKLL